MCQQWLSVSGLILDIVGFVLIAFEWRHMYMDQRFRRLDALQRAAGYPGEIDPDEAMPKLFAKLFMKEWRYRGTLFYGGVVLIVLGFIGQTAGSWPGGVISFKSC
jgi:hypothetical protein